MIDDETDDDDDKFSTLEDIMNHLVKNDRKGTMNFVEYKVVDVAGGWARGRSWVKGRHLRLAEVHER